VVKPNVVQKPKPAAKPKEAIAKLPTRAHSSRERRPTAALSDRAFGEERIQAALVRNKAPPGSKMLRPGVYEVTSPVAAPASSSDSIPSQSQILNDTADNVELPVLRTRDIVETKEHIKYRRETTLNVIHNMIEELELKEALAKEREQVAAESEQFDYEMKVREQRILSEVDLLKPSEKSLTRNEIAQIHGRMLPIVFSDVNKSNCYAHVNCLRFSAEVFEHQGLLVNSKRALRRARNSACTICNRRGATAGCMAHSCPKTFHIACAASVGCTFYETRMNTDNMATRHNVYCVLTCPLHCNDPAVKSLGIIKYKPCDPPRILMIG
jgi:hypothetical protein